MRKRSSRLFHVSVLAFVAAGIGALLITAGLGAQTSQGSGDCCQLGGGPRDTNSNGVDDDLEILRHLTPAAWQAEDVAWSRDFSPKNKIDDLIDEVSGGISIGQPIAFDVVVDFNRKLEPADLTFLGDRGTVAQVGKFLTYAVVDGVTRAEIDEIASHDGVVLVEKQVAFHTTLETSTAGMCVNPGGGCSGNLFTDPMFADLHGAGINVVIMDTGVDNDDLTGDPAHLAFFNNPTFPDRGYNALTQTFEDPDDDHGSGHGTHVASIAIGGG